jgi:hypothetical protein
MTVRGSPTLSGGLAVLFLCCSVSLLPSAAATGMTLDMDEVHPLPSGKRNIAGLLDYAHEMHHEHPFSHSVENHLVDGVGLILADLAEKHVRRPARAPRKQTL